jgi:predicted nucleotide-binding protein
MPKTPKEERIPPSLQPYKAIELLRKQKEKIDELMKLRYDDPEINKWENFTRQLIIKTFGSPHENLTAFNHAEYAGSLRIGMPDEEYQGNFLQCLDIRKKLLEGFVEQLKAFGGELQDNKMVSELSSKRVFIVHGHDGQAQSEIALILTRLGLEPIILHEQPSQGMTIIEKLEKHSDVGFAFILLTPDDVGGQKNQKHNLLPRARQNVFFEFGLFVGKLGRNKVCCLYKGDVDLPSDLQGLVYLPFKSSVNEVQLDIVKELKSAGYDVRI